MPQPGNAKPRYLRPDPFTIHVFNRAVAALTKAGLSVMGSRILHVKGRTSGQWRTTPVNLLSVDRRQYLVAPRGETQWVRNLRASHALKLQLGRRINEFNAIELDDAEKLPILRAYLVKWQWEVGAFFERVSANSDDARLSQIAPGFPVFRIEPK